MSDELHDIVAIAKLMIEKLGAEAAEIIEKRAERYVQAGEHGGAELWRRVAQAIRELQQP